MNMKRDVNKKVLILLLFLLTLIAVNFVLIAAQETAYDYGDPNLSFFQRWVQSQLTNIDAKMIIFLMVAVILYVLFFSLTDSNWKSLLLSIPISFVLTAYVTPEQVLGILRSYNTLPLMIASILPLIVLGAFTFLAIEKNKKSLNIGQWTAWSIFLIYLLVRGVALLYAYSYSDIIATSTDLFDIAINSFATLPPAEQSTTFWMAYFTQLIIAGFMTFSNAMVIRLMSGPLEKTEEAMGERNVSKMIAGAKNLKRIEEGFEKGAGI